MCNDSRNNDWVASLRFLYMSTGGYDSCYPETFHRQLISPFADLHHTSCFTNFYVNAHHSALFVQNETCDFVPSSFSFHDVLPLISISILKESFSVMFRKQYYISFLYIYMNDTSVSRDFFLLRKKETNLL